MLLVHGWAQANMDSQDSSRPGLARSHHLPPYSILCAWPRDQHSNGILCRGSQVGVPKFPKLGLFRLWGPIILCADIRLRWGMKQSCSSCQEFFNNMLHATFTKGNQGDSRLLVVGSQIGNLIRGLSFGHILCFKCPNGSCEPILNI